MELRRDFFAIGSAIFANVLLIFFYCFPTSKNITQKLQYLLPGLARRRLARYAQKPAEKIF